MYWEVGFREAVDSLYQQKLRTFLTLLGMIFGVGAVISMLSIGEGAEREALQLIDSMGMRNIIVKARRYDDEKIKEIREHSMGLTLRDLEASRETLPFLDGFSAIKEISTYALFSDDGKMESHIVGVTPSHQKMANLRLAEGRFIVPFDDMTFSPVCVIGGAVARDLFPRQNALGNVLKINHVWFMVVGIIEERNIVKREFEGISLSSEENRIFIPLQTALKRFRFKSLEDEIDEFRLKINPKVSTRDAAGSLQHLLNKRHNDTKDFEIIVPQELYEQHRATQRIFTIVMACVAGISLLVGGIGIMNIMLATVLERTREIGIRRAVGARQKDIQRQFLLETFFVSLIGGLMGIFFGILLSTVISSFAGWPIAWSMTPIILSVCVCSVIGIIFGYYPARRASHLDPIEALRHD